MDCGAESVILQLCYKYCINGLRLLPPEVPLRGAEASHYARYTLHLAVRYIVIELLIRGAGGIVADAEGQRLQFSTNA